MSQLVVPESEMVQLKNKKSMSLLINSSRPIDVSFRDISYCVDVQDKNQEDHLPWNKTYSQKTLLNQLSGTFKAGQLTAIMGASGAGKTTLLNVLSCRLPQKNLTGSITANSQPYDSQSFGDFANYVMQRDVLIQTLTVRQTLQFAAKLKLDLSEEDINSRILHLAKKFKLQKCLDVLVGGQMVKGISGGEKKRTSIAFELISDPSVLILDEPTSGLDSLTSYIIIRYLKQLVTRGGKTIFMTIHQPNSDIYALFDRLLLMIEGRFIYQGLASQATTYFSTHFGLTCPQFHNPADFFMEIMHHQKQANRQRYPLYFQAYEKHIGPTIEKMLEDEHKEPVEKRVVDVPFLTSFGTLLRRDFHNITRNPMMIKMRFLQTAFLGILTGGIFYKVGGDYTDTTSWQAITGFFFFQAIDMTMMALVPVNLVFPLERQVFLKEQGAKLYSTTSYFLSRNMVEIPYGFFFPLMHTLILYWFVGLSSTASQFFIFYLIAYLLTFCGVSLGLMLGSMITDGKSVSTVTPAFVLPFFLFSGFFKNSGNLPSWIGWIQYISPIKYGFASFTENEVQFAAASNIGLLNLDTSLWLSIGLLIILGISFRCLSLFFLWKLRTKLQ